MTKYMGAFLVAAALLVIGVSKAGECRKRCDALRSAYLMLEAVKSEICTRRTPMNKIAELLSKTDDMYNKRFAEHLISGMNDLGKYGFSRIWSESIVFAYAALPEPGMRELSALGTSLGRYDSELQGEAIDRCKEVLSESIKELQPQLNNTQKMYIALYGGVGMILAVMLI